MLLNKMRQTAKGGLGKFILFGFMALAVGGMVFMDVGGFFRGGIRAGSVAKIGSHQISISEFDNTVRRVLSAQGMDSSTAYQLGLIDRILHSEISSRLLQRAAYDSGINIGDKYMGQRIGEIVAPYTTPEISKKEALKRILMSQGMSERQFVGAVRQEIATQLLVGALQGGTSFTSRREAVDIYLYQNEERSLKAIVLPNASARDYADPTDEVLMPFYQSAQERYAIPETRSFSMAVLTEDALKKTLEISDDELKEVYERDISSYTLPEQRVLEQAILADESTARAVADAFDSEGGLKAAVEKATGKAEGYVGKETFKREGLPPPVAAAAFETEKGNAAAPVKTALGWHVMAVVDVLEPQTKPFAGVKEEIRKDLASQKLADQLYALAGEIDDRLAGGGTLEEVAEAMQLKIGKYSPVRADGSTPDSREGLKDFEKDRGKILQTVFELAEGESAPVIELADGSFGALRVEKVDVKSYKPFESVKADLRKVWIADQQEVLNKRRAQEILKSLASGEKSLEQAAKDAGVSVQTFRIRRNGNPPENLSAPAKTKFFETPGNEYAVAAAQDGYIVGQVTKVTLPDPDKISADDLKKTRETATQGSRDEHLLAYMQYLQDKAKVKINRHLLATTYGPGSGS